jgi:succinyl-CoA synthetase alpha subunit
MFTSSSKAIIYGRHLDVAQRMLDFDFLSDRSPSIAGIIDPNAHRVSVTKLFFGNTEILVSIYPSIDEIPDTDTIDTFINLASFRSATEATWKALKSEIFQNIVIIAEGIPERDIREIIAYNTAHSELRIIWPATAGAIAGWTLRMGNSGGSLENIVASGLYRRWSVGFVSRSGGMSNEMFRMIGTRTDGIHTGIALGGDRFVCSTFCDIVLEYAANPDITMIVLLGEVGSRDELEVAELLIAKKITKPVVAYVSGSFAEKLTTEVQFWHAGAKANANEEMASFKNAALREAGAYVPESYAGFGNLIEQVFGSLGKNVNSKNTEPSIEISQKLAMLNNRKLTKFTSTISDERWGEVLYNNRPLTEYTNDASIARVIGALWLKRELPEYALNYINTIIILLADHGPAVSGATNTIVTARAGKDILSSLVSGLMTIGPRFGGAIDGAARIWYESAGTESPEDLMNRMKKSGNPIQGIGHKVKNKFNPDGRCEILKKLAKDIPSSTYLDYALSVEVLTLEKKSNLILNVDGHVAASLLDIFTSIGMSQVEIQTYIDAGIFNAFFILSRSIGFIGHALDQKRLGEPLYRTAWEDIHYGE